MGCICREILSLYLEDNRLITKLDLHILELICRDIKKYGHMGFQVVPVSINLSRLDFLECNIFEEVDRIVLKNEIARDMIHIEVTESMVMDDPDIFKRVIRKFRTAGYEVWMDDFGSGYSSLNVLREFEFDEIKLNMEFMHTFDEKTKCMLKSIVSMAKGMGIKTLSEGVETEEQFAYLKEIGCGKAQGYLFHKPETIEKIKEKYFVSNYPIEERVMHSFYDKTDSVDFLTDNSLALVEYDGKEFQFLFVNDAYRSVWESIGSSNIDFIYKNMNSKSSMPAKMFRKLHEMLEVGDDFHEIRYTVQGKALRLRAKKLCQYENHSISQIELTNQNGEIIGLIGAFLDIDDMIDQFGIVPHEDNTDTMTELLSLQGFIHIMSEYMENYQLMQEEFAIVTMSFDEYERAIKTYGDKAAREIIYGIGHILKEQCESHLIPARIYGGNFSILTKYKDKQEVENVVEYIKNYSKDVHDIAGYKVTLNPKIKMYYSEDTEDVRDMIVAASGGAAVDTDFSMRKKLEEQLRDYNIRFETLVDTIPGGIALMEVVNDGFKIVYTSEGVAKLTSRGQQEFDAEMNENNNYGVVEEDVEILQRATKEAIQYKKDIDIVYRVYCRNGDIMWLHMFGKFIGEQNGHPLMMSVYQDVSDKYKERDFAKRMIDNIPGALAIFELKGNDLKRLYLSEQADRLIGGGLVGNDEFDNFGRYVYPDDIERLKEAASPENLIKNGMNIEFRTIGKDGEIYWVHFATKPVMQADGSYVFYGIYTDITELREKESR